MYGCHSFHPLITTQAGSSHFSSFVIRHSSLALGGALVIVGSLLGHWSFFYCQGARKISVFV